MSHEERPRLTREDFVNALEELGSFIDVTVEDLQRINDLAEKHARLRGVDGVAVRDLMTSDVLTTRPDTALRAAARLMSEKRIAGLPVVDPRGRLAGIVTESDLLAAMGVPLNHPSYTLWQALETMFGQKPQVRGLQGTVGEIMVTHVVTVDEDRTLGEAIQTMTRHRIKRLVVTDDANHVRGIVTRSNLIRIFLDNA